MSSSSEHLSLKDPSCRNANAPKGGKCLWTELRRTSTCRVKLRVWETVSRWPFQTSGKSSSSTAKERPQIEQHTDLRHGEARKTARRPSLKVSFEEHRIKRPGTPRSCSGWESTLQCRGHGFDPWAGKIPWRKWQPTPGFSCLENPHGQRSLVGYSPQGRKESDTTKHSRAAQGTKIPRAVGQLNPRTTTTEPASHS